MTYIFCDTETSGLIDFKADLDAPHQPRVVQLACILADGPNNIIDTYSVIIKPNGYTIPAEAAAIHGITTERAMAEGVEISVVMDVYRALRKRATTRVYHNASYDSMMMKREEMLLGLPECEYSREKRCTMREGTDVAKIPHKNGRGSYKWPTLSELHRHLFGVDFEGAHDALADAQACMRCFFEMGRLKGDLFDGGKVRGSVPGDEASKVESADAGRGGAEFAATNVGGQAA